MNEIESKWGSSNPPARIGRKLNRGVPTLIIPDCERASDLVFLLEEITGLLAEGVEHLYLEFVTVNRMAPNSALLLHGLLKQKPAGTTITAKAHSPILGSGVLVWLAADRRYLRSTGWFYLRPPLPDDWLPSSAYAFFNPGDAWKQERMAFPNLAEMDYRTVLRLMKKYFPINDLIGQVLTPALLDEFCLLDPELMKTCP